MAFKLEKAKGRRDSGRVLLIPHAILNHPDYLKLSGWALRLLMEFARQFNGYTNNGDLTAAWAVMRHRGFKSQTTLNKALGELLRFEFVVRTREGRFINPGKRCALYAITWKPINECSGKDLEIAPTKTPWRCFSTESAEIIKMPSPVSGAAGSSKWCDEPRKKAEA